MDPYFPTRIEGYIKAMNGSRWLVDQTPIVLGPATTVIVLRGQAQVGAWVRAAGKQYGDRLEADIIEVLRPLGAPAPEYQLTGRLTKQGSAAWIIEDQPIAISAGTRYVGDLRLNGLVRATVRRAEIGLEAVEFAAIAPTTSTAPFAIEGVVEQVDEGTLASRRPADPRHNCSERGRRTGRHGRG